jgi:hypothetical protein
VKLRRDHPHRLAVHDGAPAVLELLDLVVPVVPHDDVDLLQCLAVQHAEQPARGDRVAHGFRVADDQLQDVELLGHGRDDQTTSRKVEARRSELSIVYGRGRALRPTA